MDCLDLSGFRRKPQRLARNLQKLRGVAQVEPWLYPVLGGLEHRDAIVRPRLRMPAIRSSLAMSTSWRTAVITSADVLFRWPRQRLGRRISLCTPPIQ